MPNILLIAHLMGAFGLGIFIVNAFVNLYKNRTESFQRSSVQIGIGAGYQLITGSLLAIDIKTMQGLLHFCNKMGLYVGIVLFVETLLFYRMQKNKNWAASAGIAFSSLTIGLLFTLVTIFNIYGSI